MAFLAHWSREGVQYSKVTGSNLVWLETKKYHLPYNKRKKEGEREFDWNT